MIFTHLPFVSELVAQQFREAILTIGGKVAEDRVLVLSPKAQDEKIGSIIIPGNKENMPREGVAILAGELSEENKTYRDLIKVGQVITYPTLMIEFPTYQEKITIKNTKGIEFEQLKDY